MEISHKLQIKGILILILIMGIAVGLRAMMPTQEKSPYIQRIEDAETAKDLRFYGLLKRIFAATIPSVLLLGFLVGIIALSRAHLKRASVHTYKIDESEFVVHERDLHLAHQVAMGLLNSKQLKEYNAGTERALQLNMQIADIQTRNFRALVQGKTTALQAIPDALPDPRTHFETPTFQALLRNGDIQPGNPMILGFENGTPRKGSFLDIYSAAVAGESGSGKTGTLLYLIGSGIIANRVRFYGIDPHYPHPKSLGYKTKPLWEHGLMCMATYKDDMLDVLKTVEHIIDNRLTQQDTETTPVVLVIDELAFLNKTSLGKPLAHVMERISTEGRKCAVYMLASSQTWLVARTGDSSAVRDTLTSAYVHKIKPKQANLLLQSKETSRMVEKYVKKPGECLLYPVCDDPVICTMPLTTEHDMVHVANMVEPIFVVNQALTYTVNNEDVNHRVNQCVNLRDMGNNDLVNLVNARLKKGDVTHIAESIGVSTPMISDVLNKKKNVSERVRSGLITYLEKVVPFPNNS